MKIFVTSDNHLGYKEKDSIRGDDSFITFEEALQVARESKADLIIQGGDLFHDNSPSRNTLIKTISLLKKYTLGNREINFECNIELNTNDPNMNVSLPMITIHGNHDDPSGNLQHSALDILESCGLINYVGKQPSLSQIEVEPVLIYKGGRKVAIYAIGNIKDARIFRLFRENKVSFKRPLDYENYVNILVLHQNRVKRGDCDYLPPDMIDDWFDLIIYGHEHDPVMYQDNRGFTVLQCGSTVQTSLSEGELGTKYVYIIEIEDDIKINRIALKTVRPFLLRSIKLYDEKNLEGKLKTIVNEMIIGFNLPLVRIKVEINGEAFSKNKFGILFKDLVANSNDILLFSKKRKICTKDETKSNEKRKVEDVLDTFSRKIELKVIPETFIIESVRKFMQNNDKEIFNDLIIKILNNGIENVNKDILNGETIESNLLTLKNEFNKENRL
ncbi:meiotic recombination [Conglomerata obtusa]